MPLAMRALREVRVRCARAQCGGLYYNMLCAMGRLWYVWLCLVPVGVFVCVRIRRRYLVRLVSTVLEASQQRAPRASCVPRIRWCRALVQLGHGAPGARVTARVALVSFVQSTQARRCRARPHPSARARAHRCPAGCAPRATIAAVAQLFRCNARQERGVGLALRTARAARVVTCVTPALAHLVAARPSFTARLAHQAQRLCSAPSDACAR